MASLIDYRITVDLRGFKRFESSLKSNRGEMTKMYFDWARYYGEFTRKRFRRFSMGRGNWRRLKPATVKEKRRLGFVRMAKRILMRTRKMYQSLNPRFLRRTARSKKKSTGIDISYGVRTRYRGGPSVSRVMRFHQRGMGNNPRRRIFVGPSLEVQRKMARRAELAMKRISDQ